MAKSRRPGEKDPSNLMRIMPPQGSVAQFPQQRRSSLCFTRGASMNANPKFLSATAHVDEAAVKPLPNSRKVYVEGSRPDIQRADARNHPVGHAGRDGRGKEIRRFSFTIRRARTPIRR